MKRFFRLMSIALALLLMLQSSVFAMRPKQLKTETVYFMLNRDGSLDSTIVVNAFVGAEGKIVDYGKYENVQNLSTSEAPQVDGEKLTFSSESKEKVFYYRGNLVGAENPWIIDIEYFLDGKKLADPQVLTSSKGVFEMKIHVAPREEDGYATRYTLQMQGNIASGAENIRTEGATIVALGSQYTVSAVFLPGQDQTVSIVADIDGLELGAFTFTGVKAALDVDIDFDEIEDQVGQLNDGAGQILSGIVTLEKGAKDFANGVYAFNVNMQRMKDNTEALEDGVKSVGDAMTQLKQGADRLPQGSKELLEAVKTANEQLSQLKEAAQGLMQAPDPNMAAMGQALLGQIKLNEEVIKALTAINAGEQQLADGITQLSVGYGDLASGLAIYFGGVKALADGSANIAVGASRLSGGFGDLIDGQKEFVAGIGSAQTQFQDMMKLVKGDEEPNLGSFVSPRNNTDSVTFVMRTAELREPVPERVPTPRVKEKSFWGKVLELFGIEHD